MKSFSYRDENVTNKKKGKKDNKYKNDKRKKNVKKTFEDF